MRPRIVVIDECQELFVSDVGEEAAELVEKIVAKARKYGVTMLFATPVPSADSLPRKVAKVLSNKACFAIGDHQGNDAILGTGKHKAGISATTLRPMTEDGDGTVDLGDIGTAMTVGFTPTDGLMRCYYPRRGAASTRSPPSSTAPSPCAPTPESPPPRARRGRRRWCSTRSPTSTPSWPATTGCAPRKSSPRWPPATRAPTAGGPSTDLKAALPESAQPYKTKGVQQLSAHRVAEALADRDQPDPDDPDNLDDLDDGGPADLDDDATENEHY